VDVLSYSPHNPLRSSYCCSQNSREGNGRSHADNNSAGWRTDSLTFGTACKDSFAKDPQKYLGQ
jgi:hypothetical protein